MAPKAPKSLVKTLTDELAAAQIAVEADRERLASSEARLKTANQRWQDYQAGKLKAEPFAAAGHQATP